VIAEPTRPLPLSSAVPWMPAYGRDVVEHHRPEVLPVQRTSRMAYPARAMWESGAVFVASGTAVPGPDWAWISVAAEPSRAALVATLWDRITRAVRAVAEDCDATPVSAETLEYARQLLAELPRGIELPQVTVSQEGELIFTWFRQLDRLSAILAPDHYLTWVSSIRSRIDDGDVIAFGQAAFRQRFYSAVAQFYE
jgi:hypothetical protein